MAHNGRNAAWMILPVILASYSIAEGYTGNEWRTLSESGQAYYVAGVVDTWSNVVAADKQVKGASATVKTYDVLVDCMLSKKMVYSQLVAIVKKHMDAHPEEWGMEMPAIVWSAIFLGACP